MIYVQFPPSAFFLTLHSGKVQRSVAFEFQMSNHEWSE